MNALVLCTFGPKLLCQVGSMNSQLAWLVDALLLLLLLLLLLVVPVLARCSLPLPPSQLKISPGHRQSDEQEEEEGVE